jgi:hypothetical protein
LNTSIRDADWPTKRDGKGDKNGLRHFSAGIETFSLFLDEPIWDEAIIEKRANYLFEKAKDIWST